MSVNMLNNKPSAVLFDLDGTIADTALDLAATLNHLLTTSGRNEIHHDRVRNMVGEGARALIIKGFEYNNEELTDQEVEVLHVEYINYYRSHIADKTVLFPNVFITLETLVRQNIPLAICTNKSIELTHLLLKQLKIFDLFTAVTCGDSFAYKKPDPRHLITTCKLMKADPKQAIMVGDSINDIDAAKRANMLSVGVSFGYTLTPIDELSPNIIINHFNEFFDALNKVKSR
jgi:phosphoglycolate phosphatase